jgi:hypothetical protein
MKGVHTCGTHCDAKGGDVERLQCVYSNELGSQSLLLATFKSVAYISRLLSSEALCFATKKSLSWEKKVKFPIGMFCRKTRSAMEEITVAQRILSSVQKVQIKREKQQIE